MSQSWRKMWEGQVYRRLTRKARGVPPAVRHHVPGLHLDGEEELHCLTWRAPFPFLLEFRDLPHAAAPNRFEGEEAADMLGELAGVIELHLPGWRWAPSAATASTAITWGHLVSQLSISVMRSEMSQHVRCKYSLRCGLYPAFTHFARMRRRTLSASRIRGCWAPFVYNAEIWNAQTVEFRRFSCSISEQTHSHTARKY
jgi:hypothetical protein